MQMSVDTPLDSRISLQKLEVFCLVVELGGVGRAAEHLFVAQPVVSAHLRTLQERMGAQLLYRDGRTMRLTEAGERAYAWASDTLTRRRELARELDGLASGHQGSIVIVASMSLGSYRLPPILARFRAARPQAEITLNVSDPENALAATEAGESDFAVIAAEFAPESEALVSERVGFEEMVLVAAPDAGPLDDVVTPQELVDLPMISSPRDHARRALVDHELQRLGVGPHSVTTIELGHPEAMKLAAREGLGAVILFASAVTQELDAGTLRRIEIRDATLSVPVYIVRRKQKRLSPIQNALMDTIRETLRHGLAV